MSDIKPIETVYQGYRFRSRLEARWAVFFDALGIQWEYEKEGFDLDGVKYLPDFWLPVQRSWIEIKGQEPTEEDDEKCRRLCIQSPNTAICLCSGEIPLSGCPGTIYTYSTKMTNGKGVSVEKVGNYGWCECPFCSQLDIVHECNIMRMKCLCGMKYFEHQAMLATLKNTHSGTIPHFIYDRLFIWGNTPRLIAAYTAARQARFEYGANGVQ